MQSRTTARSRFVEAGKGAAEKLFVESPDLTQRRRDAEKHRENREESAIAAGCAAPLQASASPRLCVSLTYFQTVSGRALLGLAVITVVVLLTAWAFAAPARLQAAPVQAGPATLALPTTTVAPGASITVAVTLDPAGSAIASADLRITYDPAVITVTAVSRGGLIPAWASAVNQATPGVISAALAGAQAVTAPGDLLLLQLRAVGAAGASSALTFTRGDFNEGSVAASWCMARCGCKSRSPLRQPRPSRRR
jgi:hypothetical protein